MFCLIPYAFAALFMYQGIVALPEAETICFALTCLFYVIGTVILIIESTPMTRDTRDLRS